MVKAKANEIIYMHFTVFDSDGVTPLTGQAGSCTSSLRKNGAATAESVTIAEIGTTGRYYASFTPLAVSNYDLEVTCPDDRVIGEAWETETNDLDDIVTEIDANEAKIDIIDGNVDLILTDTDTTIPALIAALNDPTAASIADAVWDELLADHILSGSFGEILYKLELCHINKFLWDDNNNRFDLYDDSDVLKGYLHILKADGVYQRSAKLELL